MNIYSKYRFVILRLIRIVINFVVNSIASLVSGKAEALPPIRNDILLLPATTLAEKIRKKQLKSVDIVEAYITRIKDVQPLINAMAESKFNEALDEARKVDGLIASGLKTEEELQKTTPILGVPFTVKEHISVKGMHCTNCLVAYKDNISNVDAEAVALMRRAGGIPIATTNTSEGCLTWESENKLYGITFNPYDNRRTSGGSSGGEGALVSAAGSVIGIGSDMGGSIRIPAAFNGVFGHKPTPGVVSLFNALNMFHKEKAEALAKYSALGPICRYATDLLPMTKIMTSNNPKLQLDVPVDLKNLKIYYSEDLGYCPFASPVSKDVKKAMEKALDHFYIKYGIIPTKVQFEEMGELFWIFLSILDEHTQSSAVNMIQPWSPHMNVALEFIKCCFQRCDHTLQSLFATFMHPFVRESPKVQEERLKQIKRLKLKFDSIIKDDCVFLLPTQPQPAPFRFGTSLNVWDLGYTSLFNLITYPSTNVPVKFGNGLPVGIQCAANRYNDRLTIAVATELGKVFGGWKSPSPISC